MKKDIFDVVNGAEFQPQIVLKKKTTLYDFTSDSYFFSILVVEFSRKTNIQISRPLKHFKTTSKSDNVIKIGES